MDDPVAIATVLGSVVAVLAAWYAAGPHLAQRRDQRREDFVEVRTRIAQSRQELAAEAYDLYPARYKDARMPGLLTSSKFVPDDPIPLESVRVSLNRPTAASRELTELAAYRKMLPRKRSGARITRYSEAMASFCPPGLWFDGLSFSLEDVDFSGGSADVSFSTLSYFEGVDASEALAHEMARKTGGKHLHNFPLRDALADPLQFDKRQTLLAVSALTLRVEPGSATFFLHKRDPSKVAMAGGQVHLTPSGVHQPSAPDPDTVLRDSSPLLTLCREYAEEYLGFDEARGSQGAALSYVDDEPYASILNALSMQPSSGFGCWLLGAGVDPLTLAAELICVSIIPAGVFDVVFSELVMEDAEGSLRGSKFRAGKLVGYDFNEFTIQHLTESGLLSPAAQAGLHCTYLHRESFAPLRGT